MKNKKQTISFIAEDEYTLKVGMKPGPASSFLPKCWR